MARFCIAATKATTITNCFMVNTGAFGAPIAIGAMEALALPPVMTPIDDGCEDRATMLFMGANLKGSRLRSTL
jgi:hypothetical protein